MRQLPRIWPFIWIIAELVSLILAAVLIVVKFVHHLRCLECKRIAFLQSSGITSTIILWVMGGSWVLIVMRWIVMMI